MAPFGSFKRDMGTEWGCERERERSRGSEWEMKSGPERVAKRDMARERERAGDERERARGMRQGGLGWRRE